MDKRTAITALCGTIAIFASTQAHAEGTIIFGQRGKNLEQALNAAKQAPANFVDTLDGAKKDFIDDLKKEANRKINQLFQPIRLEFGHFAFLDAPLFTIEYSIPTNSAEMTVTPLQPKETAKPAAEKPLSGLYGSIINR